MHVIAFLYEQSSFLDSTNKGILLFCSFSWRSSTIFAQKTKNIYNIYTHVFFRLVNKLYFYCSRNLFIILIFIEKLMNAWGLFMYFFNEHIDHYCIFWTLFFCLLVGLWTNWPGKITLLFQIGYVKHIQPRLCFESFSNGKIGAIAA